MNMKKLKTLKKTKNRKTVEAYTCGICGTPDDCINDCAGSMDNLQIGIQNAIYGMNGLLSY